MRQVANLSELQTKIDEYLGGENKNGPVPDSIKDLYNLLNQKDSTVKLNDGSGLRWMKTDHGTPAFTGNLENYIAHRRRGKF